MLDLLDPGQTFQFLLTPEKMNPTIEFPIENVSA